MPISLFLQATAPAAGAGASLAPFLFQIAAIFAIFYFLMIRPQQKQRKAHEASILAMKKGDQVVTAGGIVGEVVHIKENGTGGPSLADHITVKSAESKLVIVRNRIASVGGSEAVAS
jgi:preprotein translocase subunit YajC